MGFVLSDLLSWVFYLNAFRCEDVFELALLTGSPNALLRLDIRLDQLNVLQTRQNYGAFVCSSIVLDRYVIVDYRSSA